LAEILSVDETYIVPKQGNWFSPIARLPKTERPATWVAYRIHKTRPRITPGFWNPTGLVEESFCVYISEVYLQFVGPDAEELAQSTAHWLHRPDVKAAFDAEDATVMAYGPNYTITDFYQDGDNNVLAFNVRLWVAWTGSIAPSTTRVRLTTAVITGATEISGDLVIPI
jgi:hypothetical protein